MRGATTLDVAVVVFARTPVAGRVKTRLVPRLDAWGCARLHLRLFPYLWTQAKLLKTTGRAIHSGSGRKEA